MFHQGLRGGFDSAFTGEKKKQKKKLWKPIPRYDEKGFIISNFINIIIIIWCSAWTDVKHRVVKHIFSCKKRCHCSFTQPSEMPRADELERGINKVFNTDSRLCVHLIRHDRDFQTRSKPQDRELCH